MQSQLPHVAQTHTYVVIEEVKSEQGIPLELLEQKYR